MEGYLFFGACHIGVLFYLPGNGLISLSFYIYLFPEPYDKGGLSFI
jgi:hypothetical protein